MPPMTVMNSFTSLKMSENTRTETHRKNLKLDRKSNACGATQNLLQLVQLGTHLVAFRFSCNKVTKIEVFLSLLRLLDLFLHTCPSWPEAAADPADALAFGAIVQPGCWKSHLALAP